jgi:hypothetical protein
MAAVRWQRNGPKLYQLGVPDIELKGGKKNERYNKIAVKAYDLSIFNSRKRKYIDNVNSKK